MALLKLNKTTSIKTQHVQLKQLTFQYGRVNYTIKQGSCLWKNNQDKIENASAAIQHTRCVGIAYDNCEIGERIIYATSGKISSDFYNFNNPTGTDIWVGRDGFPTDQRPLLGYKQKIGQSLDKTSFLLSL